MPTRRRVGMPPNAVNFYIFFLQMAFSRHYMESLCPKMRKVHGIACHPD